MEELSGIVYLRQVQANTPAGRSISSGVVEESSTSSTCHSSSCAAPKLTRSLPTRVVQCDSNNDVKMHAVGLAYIQMKDDGYLELVTGEHPPGDKAAFEVVQIAAPSQGKGKIFELRNVHYQQFYLTGHNDTMKVDGHKNEDDNKWSQWTATKVQESPDIQHCFKLQINAPHYAKNWYFYVKDQQFLIGEPRGFDVFQIETSN